jgi:hypothetical protein
MSLLLLLDSHYPISILITLLKNRAIRKSLYDFTVAQFETPPGDTGWAAWNVYNESNLRDKNFSPVDPYIFIIDANVAPTQTKLPMIVVEVSHLTQPHQLGDTKGRLNLAHLHVFGKNRGQRDDIASMLQDAVTTFPIYNYYYQQGTTSISERAHVVGDVDVVPQTVGEYETHEESLLNWNVVRFKFETMDVN